MHEKLMDEHEIAERLGLSVHTIRQMRSRPELGGPPYIKIGKSTVRYSASAIQKYLEGRTTDPAAPRKPARR